MIFAICSMVARSVISLSSMLIGCMVFHVFRLAACVITILSRFTSKFEVAAGGWVCVLIVLCIIVAGEGGFWGLFPWVFGENLFLGL